MLLVGTVACGSDSLSLRPIIDTPEESSRAYPYGGADELSMAVAVSGESSDLRVADFPIDESPILPSVPFGRNLVLHMRAKRADNTVAYGRTCSFDFEPGNEPGDVHLYLSRLTRWAPSSFERAPSDEEGFLYSMPDGGAGFIGGGAPLARFDVLDGTYDERGVTLAREKAAYVALEDGRALVIGGEEDGVAASDIVVVELMEVFSPDAPAGDRIGIDAVTFAAAASLGDDRAVMVGGEVGGVATDKAREIAFEVEGVVTRPLPELATERAEAVMTRLGDGPASDVLITGGRNETVGAINIAELYRPLARRFDTVVPLMDTARWGHAAVRLPDRSVLIIGGYTDTVGTTTDIIELFDSSLATFTVLDTLPSRAGRVGMTATTLPDGRILLTGGIDGDGNPTNAVFIARQDLESGLFSLLETEFLQVPRVGHQATVLCDGTVLITGGTSDPNAPVAERYNPPPDGRR